MMRPNFLYTSSANCRLADRFLGYAGMTMYRRFAGKRSQTLCGFGTDFLGVFALRLANDLDAVHIVLDVGDGACIVEER